MKIKTLKEKEEKYIIESVRKINLWDKEFIIYQWYDSDLNNETLESKIKIIFDICRLEIKAVRVEKKRIDNSFSNKKVYYLDFDKLNFDDLLNTPFIAKRRSIKGDLFLDHFLRSNNTCKYLLEIENQELMGKVEFSEFKIIKSVTEDKSYLNKNMAIPFLKEDLVGLKLLIECFRI